MKNLFSDISNEEMDEMYDTFQGIPEKILNSIRCLSCYLEGEEKEIWVLVLGYLFGLKERHDELVEICQRIQPVFYGLMMERYGKPEEWPENIHSRAVFERLTEAKVFKE